MPEIFSFFLSLYLACSIDLIDWPVRMDCYVNAPGLIESFEKSGLSHEAYLTGQCGAVFVKMLVDEAFTEKGLFVPEQFQADARRYCFQELAKLDIRVDEIVDRK